ncbi:hypothetical protein [Streptomyces lavendulocolor]|uniref:hypothetical protein n=1 Tax=Streptomyces lavendulocolor TaxID=67316 RepID=UPI0033C54BAF
MSRRRACLTPPEVPGYVAELQPDRYRDAAANYLERHPGDTFWAAMAVWRAFLAERRGWMRAHGIRRYVDGRDTLGTPQPPVAWVQETFGTPQARWPS